MNKLNRRKFLQTLLCLPVAAAVIKALPEPVTQIYWEGNVVCDSRPKYGDFLPDANPYWICEEVPSGHVFALNTKNIKFERRSHFFAESVTL